MPTVVRRRCTTCHRQVPGHAHRPPTRRARCQRTPSAWRAKSAQDVITVHYKKNWRKKENRRLPPAASTSYRSSRNSAQVQQAYIANSLKVHNLPEPDEPLQHCRPSGQRTTPTYFRLNNGVRLLAARSVPSLHNLAWQGKAELQKQNTLANCRPVPYAGKSGRY